MQAVLEKSAAAQTMPRKPDVECSFYSSCGCMYCIDGEMLASIAHGELNVLAMYCSDLAQHKKRTKHQMSVVSQAMLPDLNVKFHSQDGNMYAFNGTMLNTFGYSCLEKIATYCTQLALYRDYMATQTF